MLFKITHVSTNGVLSPDQIRVQALKTAATPTQNAHTVYIQTNVSAVVQKKMQFSQVGTLKETEGKSNNCIVFETNHPVAKKIYWQMHLININSTFKNWEPKRYKMV